MARLIRPWPRSLILLLAVCAVGVTPGAHSAEPSGPGSYAALQVTGIAPLGAAARRLDSGAGFTAAAGRQFESYAIELAGTWVELPGARVRGLSLNGLLFLSLLPNRFFLSAGVGGLQYADFESGGRKSDFSALHLDAGLGFWWPVGRRVSGVRLRGELRHRWGQRERELNDTDTDLDAPRQLNHWMLSVGVHWPLGRVLARESAVRATPSRVVSADCADEIIDVLNANGDPGYGRDCDDVPDQAAAPKVNSR